MKTTPTTPPEPKPDKPRDYLQYTVTVLIEVSVDDAVNYNRAVGDISCVEGVVSVERKKKPRVVTR